MGAIIRHQIPGSFLIVWCLDLVIVGDYQASVVTFGLLSSIVILCTKF